MIFECMTSLYDLHKKTPSDLNRTTTSLWGKKTDLQEMLKPNSNKRSSILSEYIYMVNKIQNCD